MVKEDLIEFSMLIFTRQQPLRPAVHVLTTLAIQYVS